MALSDIKAGDKVFIDGTLADLRASIVDRVTKTHIICGNNKFSIRTGRMVGSSTWNFAHIAEATPQNISIYEKQKAESERKNLAYFLNDFSFRSLPIEALQKIRSIITLYESQRGPSDPSARNSAA